MNSKLLRHCGKYVAGMEKGLSVPFALSANGMTIPIQMCPPIPFYSLLRGENT